MQLVASLLCTVQEALSCTKWTCRRSSFVLWVLSSQIHAVAAGEARQRKNDNESRLYICFVCIHREGERKTQEEEKEE